LLASYLTQIEPQLRFKPDRCLTIVDLYFARFYPTRHPDRAPVGMVAARGAGGSDSLLNIRKKKSPQLNYRLSRQR
jgi:hypothetical protein